MSSGNRSLPDLLTLVFGAFILMIFLSAPQTVYADDSPPPPAENGNCTSCHENLYFLHDTGNWFCLRESPMACVDCHGGDPSGTTEERAHSNRAVHPVINEDISKCQECHPDECTERVAIFDRSAGISQVRVSASYRPVQESGGLPKNTPLEERQGAAFLSGVTIPLILFAALALTMFLRAYRGHNGKENTR